MEIHKKGQGGGEEPGGGLEAEGSTGIEWDLMEQIPKKRGRVQ